MIIKAIPSGPFETNAYIISCKETLESAIIDPAPESYPLIVKYLNDNDLKPVKIILTHSHWDHIADVAPLIERYNIPVLIHSEDLQNLEFPGSDGLPCWISFKGVKPDILLCEGDLIAIGKLNFTVIHTPGHTPGGICLYSERERTLISGDTLFKGSIGNISFPTARPKLMWASLKKLEKLPLDTVVYPGHGEKTTIGSESWLSKAEQIFGN